MPPNPSFPATLPAEILSNIAFYLACDDPFTPPRDICALQATSRILYSTLNFRFNPPLWAAAFRYRFDDAAVQRRNFRPDGRDYIEQLHQYTTTLAAVRSRNVLRDDVEDVLRTAYVMLLDNNGKNRSQLEAAGIDVFVDIYVRTRMWSQAHLHDGWPDDDVANTCALWIMWMLTTLENLQQESIEHREQIVSITLPFVLNPYRYHQAEAPPSHFHLPLRAVRGTFIIPHSSPSAHGPYPVYANPNGRISLPYFGALPQFSPPPITIAAKLLYFARREIIPFNIPPHLPRTRADAPSPAEPSPTQEDMIEVNSHRGAEPAPRVTWDWFSGSRLLDGVPAGFDSYNNDDSKRWDCDFWRRRLCGDAWNSQPKWKPGKVYVPGSMDGLWQGRLIYPIEPAMVHLSRNATYPQHNFNEMSLAVTHQPMFMRLKEHHALHPHPHVPFPPQPPTPSHLNDDSTTLSDLSMRNAWLPGVGGSVQFTTHPSPSSNSFFPSPHAQAERTLITIDGHSPLPGTTSPSSYAQNAGGWVYETYDRRLAAERRREMERDGIPSGHMDHENCEMCREREELIRRGAELDEIDREAIAEAYEAGHQPEWWRTGDEWHEIDRIFGSVGLGHDQSAPLSAMDEDEEYVSDIEIDESGEDDEREELDYICDPNADIVSSRVSRVRRGTDRVKIEECDRIRDIVFSGTTDRRHALAWNNFEFCGRVRPWDGLIGILRRSRWPAQNFVFFYGYLVGSETFVGNWRVASADPNAPTWESAFAMSRRKEED